MTTSSTPCPTCAVTVPGLACFGCGTVQPGELAPEIAEGIARNRELYGEPCRDACGYDCLHLQGVDQCDFNKDGSRRAEVEVTGDQVRNSPVFAAFSPEAREVIASSAYAPRVTWRVCAWMVVDGRGVLGGPFDSEGQAADWLDAWLRETTTTTQEGS